MTPRPIHHWKTLWLGLLILTFLVWSWARSRSHDDCIRIRHASTTYAIGSGAGYIGYSSLTVGPHGIVSPSTFSYGSIALGKTSPWFRQPAHSGHYEYKSSTVTHRGIAHWLLILIFLSSWVSFLRWRRKKIVHLTEATSAKPFS